MFSAMPAGTLDSQLRRGVLEYCVLGRLAERPNYGHELVGRLSQADGRREAFSASG